MARQLDISMLVPQHGAPITGQQAIGEFFDWIENLMCGVDLFDDRALPAPHRADRARDQRYAGEAAGRPAIARHARHPSSTATMAA